MNKLLTLTSICLCTTMFVSAQTVIKLNMHFQYEPFGNSQNYDDGTIETEDGFDLSILPSPTISFYNETGNFHEVGISRIQYNINDDKTTRSYLDNTTIINGVKETTLKIELRYDYNYCITNSEKPIIGYLGISASPFYYYVGNEPKENLSFKRSTIDTGMSLGVVPRIIWKINNTVLIDLNVPINTYALSYKWQRIHNPSLQLADQSNGEFESTFLPKKYEVRLGVGIVL